MNTAPLPCPTLERWQPLRCGLLNIYRFDDEVFCFEKGRMILRGNNGTGKSRVLALTLPFLLDGETAPYRVEPDCDPARRMEWNLLMGKYPERMGYTWIEFGILRPDGTEEYATLGCGMRAAEGRGLLGHWFFVTSQRMGSELLLAEEGRPHNKGKLEQTLGDRGQVFVKASDYRAAVDAKLFGLGSRYGSLVNLLIQLRQPQLSRRLDEAHLSAALSEALPPLGEKLLGDVAESFRGLEEERRELENLTGAERGIARFLGDYRRYVQIAARRHASRVLEVQAEHDRVARRNRHHESEKRKAEIVLNAATEKLRTLVSRKGENEAEQKALRSGPEMRNSEYLDTLGREVAEALTAMKAAEQEVTQTEARLQIGEEELAWALKAVKDAAAATERTAEAARVGAAAADFSEPHARATDQLGADDLTEQARAAADSQLGADLQVRQKSIAHLEPLEREVTRAGDAWQTAKQEQQRAEAQFADASDRLTEKRRALEAATENALARYREWVSVVAELHPKSPDEMDELLVAWVEVGQGESPLTTALHAAVGDFNGTAAEAEAVINQRAKENERILGDLKRERERLSMGVHRPPTAPTARTPGIRDGRAGAPFWALCDFRQHVSAPQRARLEAALEASGLLDAWVMPDGRMLGPGEFDTLLSPGESPLAPEGRNLAEALAPEPDSPITAETVIEILSRIGLGANAGTTWVTGEGQWQVGLLRGAWEKPAPQHIGASAREAERKRLLVENEAQMSVALEEKQAIASERAALALRKQAAQREAQMAPSDATIRQAISNEQSERRNSERLRSEALRAEKLAAENRDAFDRAKTKRDDDARDLGLSAWTGRLQALKEATQIYLTDLAGLWGKLSGLITARESLRSAESRQEDRRLSLARQQTTSEGLRAKHTQSAATLRILKETVGASVKQMQNQLDILTQEAEQNEIEQKIERATVTDAEKLIVVADVNLSQGDLALKTAADVQADAVSKLSEFARTRLLGEAHDELRKAEEISWTPKEANDLAARIDSLVPAVGSSDTGTRERMFSRIEELKDTLLPYGFSPIPSSTEEGVFVVTILYGGRSLTMSEMREPLNAEITDRRTLLSAREREIMENYLIDEVATELHGRLRAAQGWVRKANEELARRPMVSGMLLRFDWEPLADGPAGLQVAREQLMRLSTTWNPAERKALGEFLQARIEEVRQNNAAGTWQQHLTEALDYRKWHLFSVSQKRGKDEPWRRLTKRTHGTGSGGEKAIALTMPQFAAAAAYYASAPSAPRLILLDEAFAGVDPDMRRECMGLLTNFDLDFMMTSESEWGCHPTVPGVATYHIARRDGIEAVGVTRWVWNGVRRLKDDVPQVTASGPEPDLTPETKTSQLSLDEF